MDWCPIILLMLSLAAPFTYADDSQSCGKAQIKDVIKNVKTITEEEWESKGDSPRLILQKLGLKLKEILSTSEVEHCTSEEKLQYEHGLSFVSKMLADDFNDSAEKILPLVEDEVLDDFTKLICEISCDYVSGFASQLQNTSSKIRIYQTLTKLLQETKLENKTIDTRSNLPLVKSLNIIAHQENDASVAVVLQPLLRQAIKTELDMEFGNSDELYEMNEDLTCEIIQQLIHESLIAQEKCGETGLGIMHVFDLIKCHNSIPVWLRNLELIFNELKNTNKLNTINSVIIFGHYLRMKNEEAFEPYISKWHEIVKELPERAHKIASGALCSQVDPEDNYVTKGYSTYTPEGMVTDKWVPSDQGAKSAFSTVIFGTNNTILVDYLPSDDYKFEFPVEVEHGNLVAIPKEDIVEVTSYGCVPFESLFSIGRDEPESCKLKKIIECLLNAA